MPESRINYAECHSCGHVFNPKEPRYSLHGTSTGVQKCYQCAKGHNNRAFFLNMMKLSGPTFRKEWGW